MLQLVVDEAITESLESDNLTLQNLSANKYVQVRGGPCTPTPWHSLMCEVLRASGGEPEALCHRQIAPTASLPVQLCIAYISFAGGLNGSPCIRANSITAAGRADASFRLLVSSGSRRCANRRHAVSRIKVRSIGMQLPVLAQGNSFLLERVSA